MTTDIATCPVCRMRVLPSDDHLCPSCHAYDFALEKAVSEAAATQARARREASLKPQPALHPLALVSGALGLASLALGPYPAIGAGVLAAAAGWWASRDIRSSLGADSGLWLARSGAVLGLGMASAWILILVVGRYAPTAEWPVALGLATLVAVGAWCGARLRREYRTRREPSLGTVAGVWALYTVHFALTVYGAVESSWRLDVPRVVSFAGGLALLLVGGAMHAAGLASFGSLKRLSGQDTTRLITDGIYRWSRNPQVVGWTLVLAGVAVLRASGLVLLLAGLFWLSYRMYLPLEERLLERLYGDAYRAYRSRTHRYLGPPKRS